MSSKLRVAVFVLLILFILALFVPGLPWSSASRHKLKRAIVKAEITLNKLLGNEPRLISIAGETGCRERECRRSIRFRAGRRCATLKASLRYRMSCGIRMQLTT